MADLPERVREMDEAAAAFFDTFERQVMPDVVYHYTSLESALVILQTRTMWCSNVAYSNDPAEVIYGDNLLRALLAERLSAASVAKALDVLSRFAYHAVSFSANGDSLPQWRAYAKNGLGVALGVATAVLGNVLDMMLVRVEYDLATQKRLVSDFLEIFASAAVDYERRNTQAYEATMVLLCSGLLAFRGLFKAASYAAEEEYRLFTVIHTERDGVDAVQFRCNGDCVVPYLLADVAKAAAVNGNEPFTEMIIRPRSSFELMNPAIGMLLKKQKLRCAIQKSAVVMR